MRKTFLKIFIILSLAFSAYASDPVTATAAAGGDKGMMDQLKNFFNTSMGVFIVSGVATVYSTILYKAADKQEEESKANVKKLEKLIASFKDSYTNLCPNGREDLKVPSCYCYLSNGQKNTNRSNSTVCNELWAKNSYKITADASNYGAGSYSADVAGCVTVNGDFDETCKCKKLIDSSGSNACKKTTTVTIPSDSTSSGIATGAGLTDLLNYASSVTNGNSGSSLLNAGSLNSNAIKARQITEQLTSKLSPGTKLPQINEANVNKYATAMLGKKGTDSLLASSGSGKASAVSSALDRSKNPAVENLLKEAQAKAGLDLSGSGKGLDAKAAGKKAGMNFTFVDPGSNGNGQVQTFQEEEKTYKYKNSDIVTDDKTSLFDIISNRYIQSGLKRLFDDSATN